MASDDKKKKSKKQETKAVEPKKVEVPSQAEEAGCFVVGAHAHGPENVRLRISPCILVSSLDPHLAFLLCFFTFFVFLQVDWIEKVISVSQYTLSAVAALSRIVNGFEKYWGVL
jgi:hypothetical protein